MKNVLVSGDVIVDSNIYQGYRMTPASLTPRGTSIQDSPGGAMLLYEIIQKAAALSRISSQGVGANVDYHVDFGLKENLVVEPELENQRSYAVWSPCLQGKESVWRMTQPMGYADEIRQSMNYCGLGPGSELPTPQIIVLDDAALGFRHSTNQAAWPAIIRDGREGDVDWVVLKMSSPVAQGDLWLKLQAEFGDKLVVLLSCTDLRREEVGISGGLSWERTVQDLLLELEANAGIKDLLKCRHLVIFFGSEGALWTRSEKAGHEHLLIFDPAYLEGEWDEQYAGKAFGFSSCLTAGIVHQLASAQGDPDIALGIRSGLSAMRHLHREGHGPVLKGSKPGFPYEGTAREIVGRSTGYSTVRVDPPGHDKAGAASDWMIVAGSQACAQNSPHFGLARRTAFLGSKALGGVPYARFGKLFTVDRSEIEGLRGIQRLIKGHDADRAANRPLSIAVFGAPGSGKSFGIKQIARQVLQDEAPVIEFNLSQFEKAEELIGALHQVRDKVLEGKMPIVFWDEFDAREYKWLQHFLAPMQDGKFQEGQISHPVGKCIFIFAGGTSYTMTNFGRDESGVELTSFRQVKGPDFVSRLSGYLNVLGPNRRLVFDTAKKAWVDETCPPDLCFPIRRALLVRSALGLGKDDVLEMDRGLLTALLEIDQYQHGARSLSTLVSLTRRAGSKQLMRSDLPPREQMSLHVDYDQFMALVNRDLKFKLNAEYLAPTIHEFYSELSRNGNWGMKYENVRYPDLPSEIKADNVQAALRINEVLYLVGLVVVLESDPRSLSENDIRRIIESHLEMLSEAEHDGWMKFKMACGWECGKPKDEEKKIHHSLLPYAELSEEDKEKDRDSIKNYTKIVKRVGYKIVKSS